MKDDDFFDDSSSYLVTVSDIMSGLLFVFIITLMAFVINFQHEIEKAHEQLIKLEQEKNHLAEISEQLTNAQKIRGILLKEIKKRLKKHNIDVEININHGVLRLTEDAIRFTSGSANLANVYQKKLAILAKVLAEILPCFSTSPKPKQTCNPNYHGKLDAVFIEGHTDNVPISGASDNWELSAQRAINTYRLLIKVEPVLLQIKNTLVEPLFSVTGYGEDRPLTEHKNPTNDPKNRRIELRFIMTPPKTNHQLVKALKASGLQ